LPLQFIRGWLYLNNKHISRRLYVKEQIEEALEKIRPLLQRDGGDIELVEVNDGVVKVRLTGACKGCPMSQMTLKQGVERMLMKEVPGLKEVQAV
jgi:Fe-S cluster biogenesis protein NfuA